MHLFTLLQCTHPSIQLSTEQRTDFINFFPCRWPVVRSSGRAPGPVLEGRRARVQLHVPALRHGHPADRLRKVSQQISSPVHLCQYT